MSFKSLIALASLTPATMALAFPAINVGGNPDGCTDSNGECWIADIGYFSDKDCTQRISSYCFAATNGPCGDGEGDEYICASASAPPTTPFWAKTLDAHPENEDFEILFTEDQSCPPSGPGAVFATISYNDNCVQINRGGSGPGISVYPNGGASIAAREAAANTSAPVQKRDNQKCTGFTQDGEGTPSESASIQVSSIVDCTNGNNNDGSAAPCSISESDQYTQSVTTSYSVTAGGGIEGIFDVSATFGMDYTESETTTLQETVSVGAGSKGYLSAYSSATLFKGTFTGCDGGSDMPGEALVLKQNGFTYIVVNTGAS